MGDRFSKKILDHIADRRYEPTTANTLVGELGVADREIGLFQQAINQLLTGGQVVLGPGQTLGLPPPGKIMVGTFRKHERGFGFLVPDEPTAHGDLYIPERGTGNAMSGDCVRAAVLYQPGRATSTKSNQTSGRSPYTGRIVEILQRADRQYVGTLFERGRNFVVQVDGRTLRDPVLIRDPHAKNAQTGDKVAIELIDYPSHGKPAEAVITEVLGEAGEPQVETRAIMRAYSLPEKFPPTVVKQASDMAKRFRGDQIPVNREDLTPKNKTSESAGHQFILTIDPPDARDFDDAISICCLNNTGDEVYELGVHIADVCHFVRPGSVLDQEARERGNSTYLPRRVIPMLPEALSNGVCSLQEGVHRFCKSCFIRYDASGKVRSSRFARTVIRSAKRLTYLEAQALIEGDFRSARKHAVTEPHYSPLLRPALLLMDELGKLIRKRRFKDGMIVLNLPQVELRFDDSGRVVDAVPEDDAYTHKIIEMFMVEANEAAARLFDRLEVPMIRRIHPDPGAHELTELRSFAQVAGFKISNQPSRRELQALLDSVRDHPARHAIHLSVLKTLSKAEYSPALLGHFALASEHYTHFTSPIRRFPDLVVHRALDSYLDTLKSIPTSKKRPTKGSVSERTEITAKLMTEKHLEDEQRLIKIARHCSQMEQNSEAAERELRNYLVLELLTDHVGEDFKGTVTGTTTAGLFIELDKFLVDGFVPITELPKLATERWKLNRRTGALVAEESNRSISIGSRLVVRIAKIDLGRRQMDLTIIEESQTKPTRSKPTAKKASTKKRQSQGDRHTHRKTQQIKKSKRRGARFHPRNSGKKKNK